MGRRRTIPELRSGNRQRRARRAARGQHGDPGHRRRHHQAGDGPLPTARSPRPGWRPSSSSRSTTSSCSRARRRRWTRPPSSSRREMVGAFELDPPLAVDVGVGGTGWPRSRRRPVELRRRLGGHRTRRCPGPAAFDLERGLTSPAPGTASPSDPSTDSVRRCPGPLLSRGGRCWARCGPRPPARSWPVLGLGAVVAAAGARVARPSESAGSR